MTTKRKLPTKEIIVQKKIMTAKKQRKTTSNKGDIQMNGNVAAMKVDAGRLDVSTNILSKSKRQKVTNKTNTDDQSVVQIQPETDMKEKLLSISDAELLENIFDKDTLKYILLPTDKLVAMKFNCAMPLVENNRTEWLRNEYINLQILQQKIENGELSDEEMANNEHVILDPPPISEANLMEMKVDYRQRRANTMLYTQIALLKLSYAVKIFLLDPFNKETQCIANLKKYAGK